MVKNWSTKKQTQKLYKLGGAMFQSREVVFRSTSISNTCDILHFELKDGQKIALFSTLEESGLLQVGQVVTLHYNKRLFIKQIELSVGEIEINSILL